MIPKLEAIKRILRCDWDPIGIGEESGDEYDSYAMRLFTFLNENSSERDVEAYLNWAETENMGLSRPSGMAAEIATKVMDVYRNKGRTQ
jgi:hypothetical protein